MMINAENRLKRIEDKLQPGQQKPYFLALNFNNPESKQQIDEHRIFYYTGRNGKMREVSKKDFLMLKNDYETFIKKKA